MDHDANLSKHSVASISDVEKIPDHERLRLYTYKVDAENLFLFRC